MKHYCQLITVIASVILVIAAAAMFIIRPTPHAADLAVMFLAVASGLRAMCDTHRDPPDRKSVV